MEEKRDFLKNSQIIILGVCIAFATIVSTLIFSKGLMKIKRFSSEVINVTGAAEKKITSDYTVWKATFSRRDLEMTATFQKLKTDLNQVKTYLLSKKIQENEIIVSQIETKTVYKKNDRGNDTNEIEGYLLSQTVEVRSNDVQKITRVSRESTELIRQGIEFISNTPQYFYTKLPELKRELLSEAAKDAKIRADQMAQSTGNKVGMIRSAKMGVFQITPVNSYEVSDWGENDTTSLEKKANAVVRVDFSIA